MKRDVSLISNPVWLDMPVGCKKVQVPIQIHIEEEDHLERVRDKVKYVLRTLITPGHDHFRMILLPDKLFFLYMPIKLAHEVLVLPLWILWKSISGRDKK